MEANESSQHLRWRLIIDTATVPMHDSVQVDCPVCGCWVHGQVYLNCVTPPAGVTLEEGMTTVDDDKRQTSYSVIERWTGAEIANALEDAKAAQRDAERKLKQA
jgi:hypothetical protein